MGSDAMAEPFQTDIYEVQNYYWQSASLLLYRSVLESDIGQAFIRLLATLLPLEKPSSEAIVSCRRAYGQWFLALATQQQSWQQHLIQQLLVADNPFSQQAQRLSVIKSLEDSDLIDHFDPSILAAAKHDLAILCSLYRLSTEQISEWVKEVCGGKPSPAISSFLDPKLPVSFAYEPEWIGAATELAAYYRDQGVGLFGQFGAFRWRSESTAASAAGSLVGIPTPDPIRLSQLVSYDHPKQQLIQNTESLLRGLCGPKCLALRQSRCWQVFFGKGAVE